MVSSPTIVAEYVEQRAVCRSMSFVMFFPGWATYTACRVLFRITGSYALVMKREKTPPIPGLLVSRVGSALPPSSTVKSMHQGIIY